MIIVAQFITLSGSQFAIRNSQFTIHENEVCLWQLVTP
jgi:hypothetical protein